MSLPKQTTLTYSQNDKKKQKMRVSVDVMRKSRKQTERRQTNRLELERTDLNESPVAATAIPWYACDICSVGKVAKEMIDHGLR